MPNAAVPLPDVFPLKGSEIFMLGSERNLKWHVIPDEEDDEAGNLVIEELPDPLPCDYAWSFKIQILEESW